MAKQDIINFFNKCAPHWDEWEVRKENIWKIILDNANVGNQQDVLDIACGTGIFIPEYLNRNVGSVTAVDISPEMAERAKEKFGSLSNVEIICGDAEIYEFDKQFDQAMIFNAFPHFMDPESIIKATAHNLKEGGRLSIAHDMSKADLDKHHEGCASDVSISLMEAEELAKLMATYFDVDIVISDDKMYQVSGTKKEDCK